MGKTMTAKERAKKVVTDWLWESRDMAASDRIAHLEVVAAREIEAAATTLPQAEKEAGPGGRVPVRRHIHSGERRLCPATVWWTKAALVRRLHDERVEIEKGMGEAERGLTRRLNDTQASMLMDVCEDGCVVHRGGVSTHARARTRKGRLAWLKLLWTRSRKRCRRR